MEAVLNTAASRHGQRIHIHLQLAKFLLDGDAELLLLINNQQTKVFELNVFSGTRPQFKTGECSSLLGYYHVYTFGYSYAWLCHE